MAWFEVTVSLGTVGGDRVLRCEIDDDELDDYALEHDRENAVNEILLDHILSAVLTWNYTEVSNESTSKTNRA